MYNNIIMAFNLWDSVTNLISGTFKQGGKLLSGKEWKNNPWENAAGVASIIAGAGPIWAGSKLAKDATDNKISGSEGNFAPINPKVKSPKFDEAKSLSPGMSPIDFWLTQFNDDLIGKLGKRVDSATIDKIKRRLSFVRGFGSVNQDFSEKFSLTTANMANRIDFIHENFLRNQSQGLGGGYGVFDTSKRYRSVEKTMANEINKISKIYDEQASMYERKAEDLVYWMSNRKMLTTVGANAEGLDEIFPEKSNLISAYAKYNKDKKYLISTAQNRMLKKAGFNDEEINNLNIGKLK